MNGPHRGLVLNRAVVNHISPVPDQGDVGSLTQGGKVPEHGWAGHTLDEAGNFMKLDILQGGCCLQELRQGMEGCCRIFLDDDGH